MIEEGLIEAIINKRDNFNKKTVSLIKQYMILDILYKINNGEFKDFGVVLSYKINSELLNEDVRFEVKSNCFCMELKYVVLMKEDGFYVLDVDNNFEDGYFGIKTNGTLAYIYKNILYVDGYIEDDKFQKEIAKCNFELGNKVQYNFNRDLYRGIVSFYDSIKNKPFFKDKVNVYTSNKNLSIRKKTNSEVIKEFIDFFMKDDFSFSLDNIDMDMYFNIFKGEDKDKILNLLLTKLHGRDYEKYSKNLYEYVLNGDKYISTIIELNKEPLTDILIGKHSKICLEKNLIEESMNILKNYEYLCMYNREVVYLYELIKEIIDKRGCKKISISFDGENFTDISGAIKCEKSVVKISDIHFRTIDIFTNIWSQKTNLLPLVSLNNVKKFTLSYKGEEIFKMDDIIFNKLSELCGKIYLKDIIN